jgi:hypothetical protein
MDRLGAGAQGAADVYLCRYRQNPEWGFGTQSSGNCRVGAGGDLMKRTAYECLCARGTAC